MTLIEMMYAGLAASLFLVFLFVALRCKHAWEFVDKTEFPPAILEYRRSGGVSLHFGYFSDSRVHQMCQKTIVIVLRCPKCGAAKILRESH